MHGSIFEKNRTVPFLETEGGKNQIEKKKGDTVVTRIALLRKSDN
jgi:hypothetical protein